MGEEKHKNHYVPKLIFREFSDCDNKIRFYDKVNNKWLGPFKFDTQCQKRNFYSKTKIKDLIEKFSYMELNPLFSKEDKDLEDNLGICLEIPFSNLIKKKIIPKVLDNKSPELTNKEIEFIKEYTSIQHARTFKFKSDMLMINEKILKLPKDFDEQLKEITKKTKTDSKGLIKEMFPNFNYKKRRDLYIKLEKYKKKNPNHTDTFFKTPSGKEALEEAIQEGKTRLKEIKEHIELHSANIINKQIRDSFFKLQDLNNKYISFIKNDTNIPFVLPDTGILLVVKEFKRQGIIIHIENIVYLQIHPKILIMISYNKEEILIANEKFIKQHNKICVDECFQNIYSKDIISF